MAKSDRPLTTEERAVIATSLQKAMKWVGIGRVPPTPAQIHDLIVQAVAGFREQDEDDRVGALVSSIQGLGSLYGQVLCDQFGWTWVMMQVDNQDDTFCVVTSGRSHVIYPLRFIKFALTTPKPENMLDKVYKAIQADKLPKSLPRGYMVVCGGKKGTMLF